MAAPGRTTTTATGAGAPTFPAALAAGVENPRPYDLRHSFVSLLIQEGVSIVEVPRQAGHSAQECLKTYAHTFDEFDPAERLSAEDTIRAARAVITDSDVRVSYARGPSEEAESAELRSTPEAHCRTRTGDPFLTMEVLYQLS
jgi:Phage integrase family